MEKDKAWSTGRQCVEMRAYLEWKQAQGELTARGTPEPAVAGS